MPGALAGPSPDGGARPVRRGHRRGLRGLARGPAARRRTGEFDENAIASEELVRLLRGRPESPWGAFEFDQRSLARRLRPYGLRPDRIHLPDGKQARGYRLEDFADAFARYLPPPQGDGDKVPSKAPSRAVTPSSAQVNRVTNIDPIPVTTVISGHTVTGLTRGDDLPQRRIQRVTRPGGAGEVSVGEPAVELPQAVVPEGRLAKRSGNMTKRPMCRSPRRRGRPILPRGPHPYGARDNVHNDQVRRVARRNYLGQLV